MLCKLINAARPLAALGCALALLAPVAHAVSPGELELRSYQNERMDAIIPLRNTDDLRRRKIKAGLASHEDFVRVGLYRVPALSELRFDVKEADDESFYVHITSKEPIAESFLNFILDVRWPNGRILNEYVMVLDPPPGQVARQADVRPPGTPPALAEPPQAEPRPAAPPAPAARQEPSAGQEPSARQEPSAGQEPRPAPRRGGYLVKKGDRLWSLARGYRTDITLSMQQALLAWQRANPHAFVEGNINRLKAGVRMRAPDASDLRTLSKEEAKREVARQNRAFEAYKASAPQFDARRARAGSQAPSAPRPDSELKLLASESGAGPGSGASGAAASQAPGAGAGAGREEIARAKEELDESRRANAELRSRLSELNAQVETLDELIQLRDEQLAALRTELQKSQTQRTRRAAGGMDDWQAIIDRVMEDPALLAIVAGVIVAFFLVLFMLRRPGRPARQPYRYDDEMEDTGGGYPEMTSEVAPAAPQPQEAEDDLPSMLDLARAYIEMGDNDGARRLLQEIAQTGSDKDAAEARELLAKLD